MSVPKKKRTRGSKKRRRSHLALSKIKTVLCSRCKRPKLPHQVCAFCGTYKDKELLKSKLDKKEEKKLAKQKARQAE
ncbi:50S ribosomal protein L32 [Patescibacteria group bacterium]